MTTRWHVVAGLCLINGYRHGAELGVSQGRFTSFLCATMPDFHMTAVDLWKAQPGVTGEGSETYEDWPHERNYTLFKRHVEAHFPSRVTILRMSTAEAAKQIPDGSLDMVFIDADHTYQGCLADIQNWTPKVRKDGLICGHDYNWPSVKRAVDETGESRVASDNVWVRFK